MIVALLKRKEISVEVSFLFILSCSNISESNSDKSLILLF